MTTVNPEVFRVLGKRLHDDGPIERKPYPWIKVVRLSDYEALQVECDRLHRRARTVERELSKTLKILRGLEKLAKVVSDNSDQVCGENNQLRTEVEKLKKYASREGVRNDFGN